MNDQAEAQLKIWSVTLATFITSFSLEEWNVLASIFALFCGGISSLAIAYWYIFKKNK